MMEITGDVLSLVQQCAKYAMYGCGNHTCIVRKPVGQGTNAPCRCGKAFKRLAVELGRLQDEEGRRPLEGVKDGRHMGGNE